jgi:DNA repair exonuclease SbcCD nuclease subunit
LSRLGDAGLSADVRAATRRAFDNLVELCLTERADLLVLAGDVYDGDWPSYATGEYFVSRLRDLREAGVEVALVWGNHDAESSITRRLTMPEGVRVLSTAAPESIEFADLGVIVHGQGYGVRDVSDNLAANYPKRRAGWLNVGLLHTAVAGSEGHATYAPCSVEDLLRCEYEYFALGHIHKRGTLAEGPHTVAFSGNLQGRKPSESGPKGALVVDLISGQAADVRFEVCDAARWVVLEPELGACRDLDDVVAQMLAAYREAAGSAQGRPLVVRFHLSGATEAARAIVGDPDRLDADARTLLEVGSALDRLVMDVTFPDTVPTLDPALRDSVIAAGEALAASPETVTSLLADLKKRGIPRLLADSTLRLEDPQVLAWLVRRASSELTTGLTGEA